LFAGLVFWEKSPKVNDSDLFVLAFLDVPMDIRGDSDDMQCIFDQNHD
jgi:hypothetical protein